MDEDRELTIDDEHLPQVIIKAEKEIIEQPNILYLSHMLQSHDNWDLQ